MKNIISFAALFFIKLIAFAAEPASYTPVPKCEIIEFSEIQTLDINELIPLYCKNQRRLNAAQKLTGTAIGDQVSAQILNVEYVEKSTARKISLAREVIDSCTSVSPLFRAIRRVNSNFSKDDCVKKLIPTAKSTTPFTAIGSKFERGELVLEYSMFGKGGSGGDALKTLYDEAKWDELAEKTISKRFVSNLYYYYLGRAAEEFGYGIAAEKYYQLAVDAGKFSTCGGGIGLSSCQGFIFPNAALDRIQGFSIGRD